MKCENTLPHPAPVLITLIGVMVNIPSPRAAVHVGSSPWVWHNPLPSAKH
jgi:hypothetical protein